MKKLIARVERLANGVVVAGMGCFDHEAKLDIAATHTLLELIEQAAPDNKVLETLVAHAAAGQYVSPNPALPDWGVNDVNIWLAAPMAKPGHVCVTNENTEFNSDEDHGRPQQFTYRQFRAALEHWGAFQELILRQGKVSLIGQRYETMFPDDCISPA